MFFAARQRLTQGKFGPAGRLREIWQVETDGALSFEEVLQVERGKESFDLYCKDMAIA
jgi:hypothetical protein